jgi:hypothetical protein
LIFDLLNFGFLFLFLSIRHLTSKFPTFPRKSGEASGEAPLIFFHMLLNNWLLSKTTLPKPFSFGKVALFNALKNKHM